MTYAAVAEEILSERPDPDQHRELVMLSDQFLEDLEQINLSASTTNAKVPVELADAVNQLLLEVGLEVRQLRGTTNTLDAVFAVQAALFGTPEDETDANSTGVE